MASSANKLIAQRSFPLEIIHLTSRLYTHTTYVNCSNLCLIIDSIYNIQWRTQPSVKWVWGWCESIHKKHFLEIPLPIITAATIRKKFVKPNWISFVIPPYNRDKVNEWDESENIPMGIKWLSYQFIFF